jgi:thiol-disulfide isomerase/thioredoxin
MSRSVRRTAVVLLLGAALAGCGGSESTKLPAGSAEVTVGSKAPQIAAKDLDGKPMELSQFRGKVIMLSFWAGWCGPCVKLMPHERKLYDRYKGKPFVLVGVNEDRDIADGRRFQEKGEVLWRSFADGPTGDIAHAYGVEYFPTVFLIDDKGVVQHVAVGLGPDTESTIDKKLEALVKAAEVVDR